MTGTYVRLMPSESTERPLRATERGRTGCSLGPPSHEAETLRPRHRCNSYVGPKRRAIFCKAMAYCKWRMTLGGNGSASYPMRFLVIRAGENKLPDLVRNAKGHRDKWPEDGYALSCHCIPGRTLSPEIADCIQYPNRSISTTTVGRIRLFGYDVEPDGGPCGHSNIRLRTAPTDDIAGDAERLMEELAIMEQIFGFPIVNPGRPERREE